MARRFALAATLILAGIVAVAPKASAADTVNIPFTGTVQSTCGFSNVVGGQLTFNGSSFSSSSAGSANIQCNAPASLTVSYPTASSNNPNYNNGYYYDSLTASLTAQGSTIDNYYGGSIPISANTSIPLSVSMSGSNYYSAYTAGTYNYTVTVTATPQ